MSCPLHSLSVTSACLSFSSRHQWILLFPYLIIGLVHAGTIWKFYIAGCTVHTLAGKYHHYIQGLMTDHQFKYPGTNDSYSYKIYSSMTNKSHVSLSLHNHPSPPPLPHLPQTFVKPASGKSFTSLNADFFRNARSYWKQVKTTIKTTERSWGG